MSDETGNGIFVLHSVSGCYAEVHISLINDFYISTSRQYGGVMYDVRCWMDDVIF